MAMMHLHAGIYFGYARICVSTCYTCKCTVWTIRVVATCIGTSAVRIIALCLLVWLCKKYAEEDFVSEVPVTIMHVSAMS